MTAVASASCPFSTISNSSFRQEQCPVSQSATSRSLINKTRALPSSATSGVPSFRSPAPTSEILYLPPLLSLLPASRTSSGTPNPPPESTAIGFTSSRLPEIDDASIALHFALYNFRVRPSARGYALEDYVDAFCWDELRLPIDVQREW